MLKTVTILSLPLGSVLADSNKTQFAKGYRPYSGNSYVGVVSMTQQDIDDAKDVVDWTWATSPVKNQGVCGSCWAYSTAEGVETANYFYNNNEGPVPLYTAQQMISCDQDSGCGGCNGGDIMCALDYLEESGGIDTEEAYPDANANSATTLACAAPSTISVTESLKWWQAVPAGSGDGQDEVTLAAVLSKYGPLSICLNANWDNHEDWTTTGVYYGLNDECPNDTVDHCVQLVGYDKTASPPYWKIRNSWGTGWGEDGYIKIPYGKNNWCGVANKAYLIQVAGTKNQARTATSNYTKTLVV